MSIIKFSCKAPIEGLGKKANVYTFLISLPGEIATTLNPESTVQINNVPITIKDFDGEYLSFDLPLEKVVDTTLAELEIGSEVDVTVH